MRSHLFFICVLFLIVLTFINDCNFTWVKKGEDTWSHEIDLLNKFGINIQWRNDKDDEGTDWIEMKVSAKTQGYVGVGFSPNEGMNGADMVIGWVDSEGNPQLRDFHGVSNGMPIEDPSQDYILLNATQVGNWTTVVFKRHWDTCDNDHDLPILGDTMKIVTHTPPLPEQSNSVNTHLSLDSRRLDSSPPNLRHHTTHSFNI